MDGSGLSTSPLTPRPRYLLDDGLADVVLVVREQRVQELGRIVEDLLGGVPEKRIGGMRRQTALTGCLLKDPPCLANIISPCRTNTPVVGDLLAHLVGVVDHLRLLIKHDAGRLHDQLHACVQEGGYENRSCTLRCDLGRGGVDLALSPAGGFCMALTSTTSLRDRFFSEATAASKAGSASSRSRCSGWKAVGRALVQ